MPRNTLARSRYRLRPRQANPTPTLSARDLVFIQEYLKPENGLDATQSYRNLHPNCKYISAASQACRLLQKPQVKAELARRMASGGLTKEYLASALLTYKQWAEDAHDHLGGASIIMDAAKLAGFLVEKREVKTVAPEQSEAIKTLIAQTFRRVPSVAADEAQRRVDTPSRPLMPVAEPSASSEHPLHGN